MLRWRDLQYDEDRSGSPIAVLSVRGKTGEREVIARNFAVKDYFERIRAMREAETDRKLKADEFVFCNREGKTIGSFKKGFQNLISAAGVERDSQGLRRTIYSLRHTYATPPARRHPPFSSRPKHGNKRQDARGVLWACPEPRRG
jgi:integrase